MRRILLLPAFFMLMASSSFSEPPVLPEKTIPEIIALVVELGYVNIREVEWDIDDQVYHVDAHDQDGDKIDIELSSTGEILDIDD